jgi:imidazolonepropionase-like amidohydrolase
VTESAEPTTVLKATRWLDIEAGVTKPDAVIAVQGDKISSVGAPVPDGATVIDLGDVTLMPGLMDMEVNLLLAGPSGGNPRSDVQDDPSFRVLRSTLNAKKTLLAGVTTVRNLGLFVRTGGSMLDVSLSRACDLGWVDGPRIVPFGHAISPTGGHLDPTMFAKIGPGIMPISVEEGVANGVSEVRRAVRYQLKYGARGIKVSASGGVMSHSGLAGAQQYSDEELAAIVDEAHRAGVKVAAHCHGNEAAQASIRAGIDCLEHGTMLTDETLQMMLDHGTFLVPTAALPENMDISRADPALKAKAAEVWPKSFETYGKAIQMGIKISTGTDAPAVPHGALHLELEALVRRGMTPAQALHASCVVGAELIDVTDRGKLKDGLLADIIAVPGDPTQDVSLVKDVRFVMKGGKVFRQDV